MSTWAGSNTKRKMQCGAAEPPTKGTGAKWWVSGLIWNQRRQCGEKTRAAAGFPKSGMGTGKLKNRLLQSYRLPFVWIKLLAWVLSLNEFPFWPRPLIFVLSSPHGCFCPLTTEQSIWTGVGIEIILGNPLKLDLKHQAPEKRWLLQGHTASY